MLPLPYAVILQCYKQAEARGLRPPGFLPFLHIRIKEERLLYILFGARFGLPVDCIIPHGLGNSVLKSRQNRNRLRHNHGGTINKKSGDAATFEAVGNGDQMRATPLLRAASATAAATALPTRGSNAAGRMYSSLSSSSELSPAIA